METSVEDSKSTALRAMQEIGYGSVRPFFNEEFIIPLRIFLHGKVAGMVSKVFEHPFDLTKVRLQSQVLDVTARFNGPVDCLGQTWKKEGVRGLYRVRNFFLEVDSFIIGVYVLCML